MLELAAQGNVEAQRELLLGSAKVGDVRLQAGDPDGALAAYQENRRVPQQKPMSASKTRSSLALDVTLMESDRQNINCRFGETSSGEAPVIGFL